MKLLFIYLIIEIRKKNNKIKCQSGGSSQEEQIVVDSE